MNVGLIDIEPKIFNTAYMQIAQYHKEQGDTVQWWSPKTDAQFDMVYCSSIFDFTDKSAVPKRAICGGTGFDVSSRLSIRIEACEFDYSLYPACRTSFVWFSKGCNRKCPWCVVPRKEGEYHAVKRKLLNPRGRYITVMDNDFFANPNWRDVIAWLGLMPVDIQGVDVRGLDAEKCKALDGLRRWKKKQFKIAWDNPKENLEPKLKQVTGWIKPYKLMCYVLIGYWDGPGEDLRRVETLRRLGIDPFVMPYNKKDPYQKAFARWVNHKAVWNTVTWKDYSRERFTK
ncbi:MAG: hypothetical protein ACYTEQ_30975 [Planctomycetota bacterium]|jgi:hypothetical protein